MVYTIAYDCLNFASIGGVNRLEVQENHAPLTITNIDSNTDDMSIPLFGFDSSGHVGEFPGTLIFITQYPSPSTIEATSNGSGEFITLTFQKSNDTASNIMKAVQSQYKHATC